MINKFTKFRSLQQDLYYVACEKKRVGKVALCRNALRAVSTFTPPFGIGWISKQCFLSF